jgi:hypothetical protein
MIPLLDDKLKMLAPLAVSFRDTPKLIGFYDVMHGRGKGCADPVFSATLHMNSRLD